MAGGPMRRSILLLSSYLIQTAALHCAFIHGSGNESPLTELSLLDDYRTYWGTVRDAAHCNSTSFTFANTVETTWFTDGLMHLACDAAVKGPASISAPGMPRVIQDTVVFTHSMGGLVFAAALQKGHCRLGRSAWWASASVPWLGTLLVEGLRAYCNGTVPWSKEAQQLADVLHYCNGKNLSAAYFAMQPAFPGLHSLLEVSRRSLDASLCGTSPDGIPSAYSLLFSLVAKFIQIPPPHDGLVTLASCKAGAALLARWGTNYSSLFYIAEVNHADSTCRVGDSRHLVPGKRPCSWYAAVVAAHRKTFGDRATPWSLESTQQ